MIKFEYTHYKDIYYGHDYTKRPDKRVVVEIPSDSDLESVLSDFSAFLKGCGFHFDGEIEIAPTEESHS